MRRWIAPRIMLAGLLGFACTSSSRGKVAELPAPAEDIKQATGEASLVLAGGCFWCVEAVFEEIAGVREVVSGFAGGTKGDADYAKVSAGSTDHAEVVRIVYDPKKITFGQLLTIFFSMHDPTQLNRQGPDWGRQYRTAIFYANEEQKRVAQRYIEQLRGAKVFSDPIVTTLEPLRPNGFFPAEAYHQDFVKRNPNHPYVLAHAVPKVKKVRKRFASWLKPG